MHNSALIQYFRRLNAKDLRELSKFVRSPYFNTKPELVDLFEYIQEVLALGVGSLEKKKVYPLIFPHQAFEEKNLSYTMSALLQLIKRYLAISEAEQEAAQQQFYLCRALRQRRMEKQFQQELEQAYKRLQKYPLRNTQYHYQQYLLKLEEVRYTNTTLDQRRGGAELLENAGNALTAFYIAELLRHGCDILALQSLKSHEYDLAFIEEVLRYVDQSELSKVPAVSIYYHSYQAMKGLENKAEESSADHFNILKQQILTHWRSFSKQEIKDIYTLAVNFCIQRLNRGDKNFIREAFDLYRFGLDHQIWTENKVLSGYTYKNIARLGLALEEEEWVSNFIENYKNKLPKKEREQYWRYNMAYLYFQKNNYHEAMLLLREVEFKDVFNNLDTRRMLLRCYFVLEEITALEYLLDSFQKYIQRQKGIGYHKNNYLNLIRFVRKKLQIPANDRNALKELAEEIRNTEQVAEKNWLIQQLS